MKTAYVTGATGCVGRNLVNELLDDGWHVLASYRKSSKLSRLDGLKIDTCEVDLHDADSVMNSVPDGIDAIFHVAANTSHWPIEKDAQWKDNVLATRHLVNAAVVKRVRRFILTSTGATSPFSRTTREEAESIESQYVRTKRLSELELIDAMRHGLDGVILQPAIVVGAFDYNSYSQIFTAMASRKLGGVLPGTIEFCHARDVARAHITAFETGRRGESYILGGHTSSWLNVYQKIARLLNLPVPKRQTPLWALFALAYPMLWVSYITRRKPLITPQLVNLLKPGGVTPPQEVEKARRELNYQSASIDQMLQDCYQWLVHEGVLVKPESAAALLESQDHALPVRARNFDLVAVDLQHHRLGIAVEVRPPHE